MNHQEGFFAGVKDANIYYQGWLPEGAPRAGLLVAHGLAEHSGRYMNVVNHFVPKGYAVYGLDHYGHGKSEGKRVYVNRFDDFIETLRIYFEMVRGWHPRMPLFLIGHSMGGLISANYLLKYQAGLAGAVLSGPAMKAPGHLSPATMFMGRMVSAVMPGMGLLQLEAEGVSRDPAVVQAYINDPLVTYPGKVTARLAAEMIQSMQIGLAEAGSITLPLVILQGSADPMIDPAGAQLLYDAVGSTDKTIKIYEGLYHEVFNEPEQTEVLGDVEAWLEAHYS